MAAISWGCPLWTLPPHSGAPTSTHELARWVYQPTRRKELTHGRAGLEGAAQPKRWHVGRLDGVDHLFGVGCRRYAAQRLAPGVYLREQPGLSIHCSVFCFLLLPLLEQSLASTASHCPCLSNHCLPLPLTALPLTASYCPSLPLLEQSLSSTASHCLATHCLSLPLTAFVCVITVFHCPSLPLLV